MGWTIEFAPLIPWQLLGAGAMLALLLAGLLAFRRSRGLALRALATAAVLGALANPTLRQEQRQGLSNIALIVTDKSQSQTIANRPERAAAIRSALDAQLARIPNLDIRYVDAGLAKDGGDHGTELFGDLSRALTDIPTDRLAGVVAITDGQIEDVPKAAAALGFDAPVHAILTGAEGEFDRRIEVLKAPRYGLVGSEATAEITVRSTGTNEAANAPAHIAIKREGQPDLDVVAAIGETVRVPMSFPHAGTNISEVELAAVPGEISDANNHVVLPAEGVRQNLKVLLVSGEPHPGERTWRNLLKSDASVDLIHFTILRPPQKLDGTPINELSLITFPTRELFSEKIDEFDLIIFDRYASHGILPSIYIDNIARYVENKGGAVLVAAGDDYATQASLYYTPLAAVLPAEPTGAVTQAPYKPAMTTLGLKHPVTAGLPGLGPKGEGNWGRWFRTVDVGTTSGSTVMSGADGRPLLILDKRGNGRVALMLSDQAWLWARGYEGGGPYEPLLRRLAHWLMKEPDLEEEHLSAAMADGKLTVTRRSMGDKVPAAVVTAPSGAKSNLDLFPATAEPGIWRGTADGVESGFYKIADGQLAAVALSGTLNAREMSELTTTATKLSPLAEASGGGMFWSAVRPGSAPGNPQMPRVTMLSGARVLHGSDWLGLKDRDAHIVTGVQSLPVATGLWALAALLGLLTLAWWREGR